MNRRSKIQLIKYILYSFLMIVLYVLQTDPNFTLSSGTGPVLVLPFAVAVAMFDGQLAGGLFGLFAGILCDTSSSVLFGFGSILYLVICTAVGLLVLYFMQPSLTNSIIFTGSGFAVRLLLEYFFYYAMWGYENSSQILLRHMLPNLLCTLLVTPLIFLAVRRMHRFFEEKLE